MLELQLGNRSDAEFILSTSVRYCPGSGELWTMLSRHRLGFGDVAGARSVLSDAFKVVGCALHV